MKAIDSTKINSIITAINEKVANLDTTLNETETDIILTIKLPKAGVVGRPRNKRIDPLQAEMAAGAKE